jgi:hypothetical protein
MMFAIATSEKLVEVLDVMLARIVNASVDGETTFKDRFEDVYNERVSDSFTGVRLSEAFAFLAGRGAGQLARGLARARSRRALPAVDEHRSQSGMRV